MNEYSHFDVKIPATLSFDGRSKRPFQFYGTCTKCRHKWKKGADILLGKFIIKIPIGKNNWFYATLCENCAREMGVSDKAISEIKRYRDLVNLYNKRS